MRNGLPLAYGLYRILWSIVHLTLVALALIAAAVWFLHDDQGVDLALSVWTGLTDAQYTIANTIPFPWGF